MRMFPCPPSSTFRGFDRISVLVFLGIDEFDITFIDFGLFINKREDTSRTCQSKSDRIQLLTDLTNRLNKGLGIPKERRDDTNGVESVDVRGREQMDSTDIVDPPPTSDEGNDCILEISKLVDHRP